MINRFLRRLNVRSRIFAGYMILLVLSATALPLIVASQRFVIGRVQQITDVDARADRLLLLASTRVESSRVNLMRYVLDYAPSVYEAQDDLDQAETLLQQAGSLAGTADQKSTIETIRGGLVDYGRLIDGVQAARAQEQDVSRSLFQAYRLGNDIGQRIEEMVADSAVRVAAANEAVYDEARRRLILIGSGYAVAVVAGLVMATLVERSITRPVAEMQSRAEAFRQGQMDVRLSETGSDELSTLARVFNQMAAQVRELIGTLEQRVADRTRDAERRAVQITTASEVGRVVASILDMETLTARVVDVVRERFNLYYAALFLLDETGRHAVLEAGTGEAGREMKARGHRLEVGGLSMVGAACALRQARVAQDVGHEPTRFDNPLLPETRTEAALPLVAGNRVVGALDVQSSRPAAFAPDDIAVLQLVADQVAVAIDNARLFTEVQNALQAERRAYGEVSRAAWQELIRNQITQGYASDEQGLTPVASHEAWRPEMNQVLREGRLVTAPEDPGALLAPIRVRDQVIGVIDARKARVARATGQTAASQGWTEEETALLQTLAEQLGNALDGARLYYDVQRRATRERLTAEVTGRLRETLQVEKVLQTAAYELGELFQASEVKVRLVPPADGSDHAGAEGE